MLTHLIHIGSYSPTPPYDICLRRLYGGGTLLTRQPMAVGPPARNSTVCLSVGQVHQDV